MSVSDPTPSQWGVLFDRMSALLVYCIELTAANPFSRYYVEAGSVVLDIDEMGGDETLCVEFNGVRLGPPALPQVRRIDSTTVASMDITVWATRRVTSLDVAGNGPTDAQRNADAQIAMLDLQSLLFGIMGGVITNRIWPGQVSAQFLSVTSLSQGDMAVKKILLSVDTM